MLWHTAHSTESFLFRLAPSRGWLNPDLRCTIPNATLAALNGAGQFLDSARFEADILPSLVQCLLDLVGHIDDRRDRNNVVPTMDEAIEDLIEPETVLRLAVLVQIADFASMQNLALSS